MTIDATHSTTYGGWRQLRFLSTYRERHLPAEDAQFNRLFDALTETEQDSVAHIVIHKARRPAVKEFTFLQYFPTEQECNIFPFANNISQILRTLSRHFNLTFKYQTRQSLHIVFEEIEVLRIPFSFRFYDADFWEREELSDNEDDAEPPNKRLCEALQLDLYVGV